MGTKSSIMAAAERFDAWLPARAWQPSSTGKHVAILLVHSLYEHVSDPDQAGIYPHERMTVSHLRELVEYFLERGFAFVTPQAVIDFNDLPESSMVLTFDDGYFNFVRVLPILHEYRIPATLFLSPAFLVEAQSFWWDAFYRHARKHGIGDATIRRELATLRKKPFADIYDALVRRWGKRVMQVASDLDRPLTMDEFHDVARDPWVYFGNHTFHHTALPFQPKAVMRKEIQLTRDFLKHELGTSTEMISFPNGDFGDSVFEVCDEFDFKLGMTIEPRWNKYRGPVDGAARFLTGRYMVSGDRDMRRQAHSICLKMSLTSAIRRLKRHRFDSLRLR